MIHVNPRIDTHTHTHTHIDDDVPVTGKSREPKLSKLKPRGPAPPPPPPANKSHTLNRKPNPPLSDELTSSLPASTRLRTEVNISKTVSKSRDGLDSLSDNRTSREEGSKVNSIRRKRPSRPAPVPPPVKPAETETQTQIVDFSHTSPPPQLSPPSQPSPPSQVLQHSTPSPKHIHSSPVTPRRANAATAICQDTEDGGKVLIVQPSPSTDRKQKNHTLIFKLPPPPPQPNVGGSKEQEKTNDNSDTAVKNKVSFNTSVILKYICMHVCLQ